jgi:hypothetical protein
MPSVNLFVAEPQVYVASDKLLEIQSIIARLMSTRFKKLTSDQVSIRIGTCRSMLQINSMEVEVFGHVFWHRVTKLDVRARSIADEVAKCTGVPTSCWINLCLVGYAPSAVV